MTDKVINEPSEEQKNQGICVWYDNDPEPKIMFVSIPLEALSKNPLGTALLRGFLEEQVKGTALYHIKNIKIKNESKIIQPSKGGKVPLTVQ